MASGKALAPSHVTRTFTCGRLGVGKTSLNRALVKRSKRLLVVDPFREHDVVWCDNPDVLAEYLDGRKEFRAGLAYSDDCDSVLHYAQKLGACDVVIEEIAFVAPPGQETPLMKVAIAQGRHWGVNMLASSQRPFQCSRLYTGMCTDIYSFAVHEPRDVQYLRAFYGAHVFTLPGLDDLHALHWKPSGYLAEVIVDPAKAEIETARVIREKWNTEDLRETLHKTE